MSKFHIGQKVVCVNNFSTFCLAKPQVGSVYTISNLYLAPDGDLMLELVEILAPETDETFAGFRASSYFFRPVRTTDISIFTAMLAPTPPAKVQA